MSTTQRIAERLPGFYKTWAERSLLLQFLNSFGNTISEAAKDLFRVMRGHWVDTARSEDLDNLASIFGVKRELGETDRPFRRRIKRAIQEYKGGGTLAAIELALRVLLGPFAEEARVIEFPPTPLAFEVEVTSGDTWTASSLGISDVAPSIVVRLETREAEVRNPQIMNLGSKQSVGVEGALKTGEELVLKDGKAIINGTDATKRVVGKANPPILRKGSDWQYTEYLHGRIGVFDSAVFDESFFAIPLPKVRVRFDWITRKASTVQVTVSRNALDRTGLKEDEILRTLNAIKAVGVEVVLTVEEAVPVPRRPEMVAPGVMAPVPAASEVPVEAR